MRKLLILLLVLVVAAAAGDLLLRNFASDRISARLASSLDLDSEPEVEIGGFPFLPQALRGRFQSISVSGTELTRDDVRLEDVALTLLDVKVAVTDALTNLDKVKVSGGRGTAVLGREEIIAALEAAGTPGDQVPLPSEGEIPLEGASLVIGPHNLPLPVVTDEMVWERARISDGDVHLSFRLGRTELDL